MDQQVVPLDELAEGLRQGIAVAVRDAHAHGLPVFEADDTTIYAVYPDGRRIAVERLPRDDPKAA
ncbi:hypothetical protein [Reyranella sp. CPCC 100927]|uniref:hypothetical protein n=1 Tax=Reyranella sp. CPCC 100927 TaxID=2599616 RepID=UPI0011B71F67|nr:hypothetical protein [Reyranella sp. CPCC 100927]TWT15032.1 hypothetical protein FQU96_01290 [Reyranella sp. CPCC 100927]